MATWPSPHIDPTTAHSRSQVRSALGSITPKKLAHDDMATRSRAVKEAQQTRKMERERERNLADLKRSYTDAKMAWPPAWRSGGPWRDLNGVMRGHCIHPVGCPGFDSPQCALTSVTIVDVCVHCGCPASQHEKLRSEADRKAEREDDILLQPLKD